VNIVLWVVQGVLAAVFLGAGLTKVTQSKEQLETKMGWVNDFDSVAVKIIGFLEMLAGLALIVPPLLGAAPRLTAWAAIGLTILMIGAVVIHVRRREPLMIVPALILLVLAAVAAWGRFGPYSF
jgi:uncharacterized membrane protein